MRKIIIIAGPTASHKSSFAMKLAAKLNGVIINADAMQIYKNAPILSAQPSVTDQQNIPHKLYGFADDYTKYDVSKWVLAVKKIIDTCVLQSKTPILVGGTGMYISSLLRGLAFIPEISEDIKAEANEKIISFGNEAFFEYLAEIDPQICSKLHMQDTHRIVRAYEVIKQTGKSILWWQSQGNKQLFDVKDFIYIITTPERKQLYSDCNQRFDKMIEMGGLDEIQNIYIKHKDNLAVPIKRILGVKEIMEYLSGNINFKDAIELAKISTRRYAKRQVTWFKNQLPEIQKRFCQNKDQQHLLLEELSKEFK